MTLKVVKANCRQIVNISIKIKKRKHPAMRRDMSRVGRREAEAPRLADPPNI